MTDAPDPLDLGLFSVSLRVADLDASLAFYAALGFRELGGEGTWRIIGNGSTKLGLFAEHIDENILTFNPGIAQDYEPEEEGLPEPLPGFTDVREIAARLERVDRFTRRPLAEPLEEVHMRGGLAFPPAEVEEEP